MTSLPWSHLQHQPYPRIYGPLECWEITSWSMGRWRGFPRSGLELDFYVAGRSTGLSGGWSRSRPLSIAVRVDQPQTWLTKPQHSISKSLRSRIQNGSGEGEKLKQAYQFPAMCKYYGRMVLKFIDWIDNEFSCWEYHSFAIYGGLNNKKSWAEASGMK